MRTFKALAILMAAIAPLAACPQSYAGTTSLVINGRSHHLGSSHDWNENNLGIGIEYQLEQTGAWRRVAMANGFRDSSDSMSYMAGFGLQRRLYETEKLAGLHVYAGLNAFLMTREDVNDNRPFPGVLPSLTIGTRAVGINLTYLPKAAVEEITRARMTDGQTSGIVFMQLKIALAELLP